jgi:mRNA interferase RelE/StbE
MSCELAIHPLAESEWGRLDGAVRKRFKQKLLTERLLAPRVAKDALHGLADTYKIKITSPQYRLAYHVDDQARVLTILAISTRDEVYELLKSRK